MCRGCRRTGGGALAAGGRTALASKGAGGARCKLTATQIAGLDAVLDAGPGACGYADHCWTLARIADHVQRRFGAADLGAWVCFEDESGQGSRPPKGRT